MALRVRYPSFRCLRSRPYWSFGDEDDISSFALAPRFRCRRVDPFVELEQLFEREFNGFSFKPLIKKSEKRLQNQETSTKDENFTYNFDLKGFEPGDVKVKTVGKKVVVEAENEKKSDEDGYQSYSRKQYHQSVVLPDNVNPDDVISTLSDKGILRISAPTLSLPAPEVQEKEVEVQREETTKSDAVLKESLSSSDESIPSTSKDE